VRSINVDNPESHEAAEALPEDWGENLDENEENSQK